MNDPWQLAAIKGVNMQGICGAMVAAMVGATATAIAATPSPRTQPPAIVRVYTSPPPESKTTFSGTPAQIVISADGKGILVAGALTSGVAERFRIILTAAPAVRTVILYSNGGLIGEALSLSRDIKSRALNTYVEGQCVSACTIVLLAGADRAATPNSKIGFHEFIYPGSTENDIADLKSIGRRLYDDAGVSPTFTDKVMRTPSSTVWYPTSDELIQAHVLTRISLGGETSTLAAVLDSKTDFERLFERVPYWVHLKTRFPDIANRFIDAAWQAKSAGKTDAEITNAGRTVLAKSMPQILNDAPDDVLISFLDLLTEQLTAARSISFDACAAAVDGTLNTYATLPKELTAREMSLMDAAISSPPQHRPRAKTLDELMPILKPIYLSLPTDQLTAIASENGGNKAARCDGMLALFKGVHTLQRNQQVEVVRALYSAE